MPLSTCYVFVCCCSGFTSSSAGVREALRKQRETATIEQQKCFGGCRKTYKGVMYSKLQQHDKLKIDITTHCVFCRISYNCMNVGLNFLNKITTIGYSVLSLYLFFAHFWVPPIITITITQQMMNSWLKLILVMGVFVLIKSTLWRFWPSGPWSNVLLFCEALFCLYHTQARGFT